MRRYGIFPLVALLLAAGCGDGEPIAQKHSMSLSTSVAREPWSGSHSGGVQLATPHYRIYTTSSNPQLLSTAPGFMEAAYRRYADLTGLYPAGGDPMAVYVMSNRQEWAALTRQVVGPRAPVYLQIEAGGYCYQGVGVFWDIGGLGTLSVAAHEGLHQFLFHNLTHHLPVWAEEGLCTVMEGYEIQDRTVTFTPQRNIGRFSNLRAAMVRGDWIPLQRLLRMDPGEATTGATERAVGYYGQLWALLSFINSSDRYRPGLERMLSDAAAGRIDRAVDVPPQARRGLTAGGRRYNRLMGERLFRAYISDDLDGFEREYHAYAERVAGLD